MSDCEPFKSPASPEIPSPVQVDQSQPCISNYCGTHSKITMQESQSPAQEMSQIQDPPLPSSQTSEDIVRKLQLMSPMELVFKIKATLPYLRKIYEGQVKYHYSSL